MLEGGQLHSAILWGHPALAKRRSRAWWRALQREFIALSAVLAGGKTFALLSSSTALVLHPASHCLFLDEVHRFNKAQQDAFLPWVEDGTLVFIGATTENPSFELNNALLSRARVYVLRALTGEQLQTLMQRALSAEQIVATPEILAQLGQAADGDARRALNMLELAIDLSSATADRQITAEIAAEVSSGTLRRFDKQGEAFYDQISALHKSVRGSDPDAALYWFCRMLDGGCDPRYIARRVLRMASEDIGNADPRALTMALEACECTNVSAVLGRLGHRASGGVSRLCCKSNAFTPR